MKQLLKNLSDWYFSKAALPYWCVLAMDCVIVVFSNIVMFTINYGILKSADNFLPMIIAQIVYLAFYLVGFRIMHTYSGVLRFSSFLDLLRIGIANIIGVGLILLVRVLFKADVLLFSVGGIVHLEGLLLATMLMWFMRIFVKFMYDGFFAARRQKNVFIYGVREGGIALAKSIRSTKPSVYQICGFISDDVKEVGKRLMAKRVYPINDELLEVLKKEKIEILLVSPLKSEAFRENTQLQMKLMDAGIKIHMMPAMEEWDRKSKLTHDQLKEVDIVDLLPREPIEVNMKAIGQLLTGKVILITGSAGSIGSEMVRQIAKFKPKCLVLIDSAETPQHDIRLMMARQFPDIEAHTIVTTICNESRMKQIFSQYRPEYVFHAAAYKHVPMMEDNPSEAVQNNIRGTEILARMAVYYGVKKFVMISTDKAVNPTNVMGCSKRICEIDVQSLDASVKRGEQKMEDGSPAVTQFVTTRFGNVLGSNGSVIPLFKEQIKKGGPMTVTHPDIIRFFMLIPEACKLVLEAGTMGHGGEIFVFDMGKPVRIVDLAERMIKLSGAKNIEIKFTGLRDGEKLFEEVLADKEQTMPTIHPKIMVAAVREADYQQTREQLKRLYDASFTYDNMAIVAIMKEMVPEFKSQNSVYQALD